MKHTSIMLIIAGTISVGIAGWIQNGSNIYTNDVVGVGSLASVPSKLYVENLAYGPYQTAIYTKRQGTSGSNNGGTSWNIYGIDAGMKSYSYWGNKYSAAVAGFSYLDYPYSTALFAGNYTGTTNAKLAYKDETSRIWAGHFEGDVKVTGKFVLGTGNEEWSLESVPDYVFNDDYKMQDLAELENFVKLNKHLPEVPSAKEFVENGLDIAKMNFTLLKKVEELTLHLIEQNRKIQTQQKQIDGLLSKLN